MKIKKKNTTIPISGKIVDTENVEDKTSNAPSMRLVEEMTKDIYSTEEQVIGTWIDGKPLYRKVIDFGALPSSPLYKYVNHNIQNISQIVFLDGFCIDSSSEWAFPVNCIRPNTANSNIGCYASKTQIVIECGVNRSSYRAYITLEYTKTTD